MDRGLENAVETVPICQLNSRKPSYLPVLARVSSSIGSQDEDATVYILIVKWKLAAPVVK